MATPMTRSGIQKRLDRVLIRLSRYDDLARTLAEKRKKTEALRDALIAMGAAMGRPVSVPMNAPVQASFEKGDPVEWDRSYAALNRLEGRGAPEETHDPVTDLATLHRLDPSDRAELLATYAERVGPIQRFTEELHEVVQNTLKSSL